MKLKILSTIAIMSFASGCVQKSYNRTIIFSLEKPNIQSIKSVGIRGNDKPLSWESDYPMKFDSVTKKYKAIITMNTGYLFTEVKFTVNGAYELKDMDNRKIHFLDNDTIYYKAIYNKR